MSGKTVGYIGLGNAGGALALLLIKSGYKLVVRDADKQTEDAFVKANPEATLASKSEDFASCDLVFTMLPNGNIVREVLLGADGIAQHLKKGIVVVDTSSSAPNGTVELGKELSEKYGLRFVDSPITQTHLGDIARGAITFMIGGEEDAIEEAMPVLKCLSAHQFRMGKIGNGHVAKTLNNYVSAASIVALSDSFRIATKLGLDPLTLNRAFDVGTARNFTVAEVAEKHVFGEQFRTFYQLNLLVKDLGINKDMFEREGGDLDTQLPQYVHKVLQDSLPLASKKNADHSEFYKIQADQAGITYPRYSKDQINQ